MPRAKRLNTAEAADRLGVSERQMRALAKSHWIGKKEGGGWTFTETEIRKLAQERQDHAAAVKLRKRLENERRRMNGLPPKRKKKKKTTRHYDEDERPRRRRGGPLTIDDILDRMNDPLVQLDMALARQRAIEQTYNLPFIAPHSTRYGLVQCPTCGDNALLLIDCDNGRDESGIDGYQRMMADLIEQHRLPTILRLPPDPPPPNPASRMTLRLVWPDGQRPPELRTVTQTEWDRLVDDIIGGHCSATEQTS
jgi:hypothetical protein